MNNEKKSPANESDVEYPTLPPYPLAVLYPTAPPATPLSETTATTTKAVISQTTPVMTPIITPVENLSASSSSKTESQKPQQTIIVQPIPVGPEPCRANCPSCGEAIITNIKYEPTTKTHLIALLLCCLGCCLCSCVPYCMDSCQNGNHYCSKCGAYIGTYQS